MFKMAPKLESHVEAVRRVRAEFDSYSDSVALTEIETGAVTGFSPHTLKFWRLNATEEKPTKGPKPVYMFGMVKYTVGEIRRWRKDEATTVNEGSHVRRLKAPHKITTAPAKTIRRLTALGLEEL
jgi:hypothetical protein